MDKTQRFREIADALGNLYEAKTKPMAIASAQYFRSSALFQLLLALATNIIAYVISPLTPILIISGKA